MTYSDKLKDPRWQKLRLEVFQRDSFCCLMCGSAEHTLHVHHLRYCKNPWDVPIEALQTLCFRCHEVAEVAKKENINYKNVVKLINNQGYHIYLLSHRIGDSQYIAIIHDGFGKFTSNNMIFSEQFIKEMLNAL